jgi:hypothetical protein
MMNAETTMIRSWSGDVVEELWNRGALRATVLIESAEREALAILIDDCGEPRAYRIANDQVPAFIAAATGAWSRSGGDARSVDAASVAVIWGRRLLAVSKGGVVGPVPGPLPMPDPLGVLRAAVVMAHHQLLAVLELALRRPAVSTEPTAPSPGG